MARALGAAIAQVVRGLGFAVKARPGVFALAAAAVLALDVFLPPLVLSLARKPCDHVTTNPWLPSLPRYLASPEVPLGQKAAFLPNLALFWFSADSPYGVEWGVAVSVADLARFLLTAGLFGAYFALWSCQRDLRRRAPRGARVARPGGVLAAAASVVSFSTGGCSVMGCGAPVVPVLGLAFTGLSSGTLAFLARTSSVATTVVLVAMTLGVAWAGWRVGAATRPTPTR